MATIDNRRWVAGVAAVLVAFVAGTASADVVDADQGGGGASEPFLGGFLKETRIVYPLRVGDWGAVGEKLYNAAELGASVRYQSGDSRDRWIDIYFYPVGVVPDSHVDQAARVTLQEIESQVGIPGGYVEADLGPLRVFQVASAGESDGESLSARSADMRLLRDDVAYHSAMTLLVDRMYYVKGRHSVAAGAMGRGEVRGALEAFVAELVRGTYIGSTGRCWLPAPIEALPADMAAPEGARLAMSMDGRLHPGCVGAEPHNPDVPEGYREIRFEYRVPTDAPSDRGGRLAPSRGGLG